ncbi:MAG: HDIG domain-containing protein [Dysgonamonadaceae bacterium]|jgi:uncharacterized protein|nr:HDIG domain-containing protein [Dysgonamonadaceae bacterium]
MAPVDIIKKYYEEGSLLYNILFVHSLAVANKALNIVQMHPELNIDKDFVYEAALLHDIGIFKTNAPKIHCFGNFKYVCHGYLGAEIMRKEGFEKHALVCERHTGSGLTKESIIQNQLPIPQKDMLPVSWEEKLICFSDKFYSKSKLNKVKTVEQIRKDLSKYGDESVKRFNEMLKLFLG